MSNTSKTVIESLPTKLWMVLFQYFNCYELYHQFIGLNSRIDSMIQLTNSICLQIDENNETYCLEHILPSIHLENIRSLSFNSDSKTGSVVTQFFLLYSLNKFTELRSFTFRHWFLPHHSSRELIEQLKCLTHLKKLDIDLTESSACQNYGEYDEESRTRLIDLIFNSNRNLQTSLKYLVLDMYIGEETLFNIIFLPTNLEYLEVSVIDLRPFLSLIPSLETRCKTISFKYLEVNSPDDVPPQSSKVLKCCTKLTFKTNCDFRFKHLEIFLSCFPEVKQLTIDNSSADEIVTAEELERLLKYQCSKVLKFEYAFNPCFYDSYRDTFTQSKFWLNRDLEIKYHDNPPNSLIGRSSIILQFDLNQYSKDEYCE